MATSITPIIDGTERASTHLGDKTFTRRYIVHGMLSNAQTPQHGYEYTAGGDWPDKCWVVNWNQKAIIYDEDDASHSVWELTVIGSYIPRRGTGPGPNTLKRLNPVRSTASVSFVVDAEHVGARRAKDYDTGIFTDPETGALCWRETDEWAIPKARSGGVYIYCEEDDWIYKNGSPALILNQDGEIVAVTETIGTPETTNAPFLYTDEPTEDSDAITSLNPLRLRHIGKSYDCLVHQVIYWIKTDRMWNTDAPGLGKFSGCVTDWGPMLGGFYGPLCTGIEMETECQWKCDKESIAQDFDTDGERALKVTRTFIRVPSYFGPSGTLPVLRWNPNVLGTWDWDYIPPWGD